MYLSYVTLDFDREQNVLWELKNGCVLIPNSILEKMALLLLGQSFHFVVIILDHES